MCIICTRQSRKVSKKGNYNLLPDKRGVFLHSRTIAYPSAWRILFPLSFVEFKLTRFTIYRDKGEV